MWSASVTGFSDVKGRNVESVPWRLAVAGSHNAILVGSPGSSRTMMARRLPGILPPADTGGGAGDNRIIPWRAR
ncbi:MAG: ATP-binding protein [Bacteroidales bacterium]|nr:ATP-binding protein [Bacteroidales bacterium]